MEVMCLRAFFVTTIIIISSWQRPSFTCTSARPVTPSMSFQFYFPDLCSWWELTKALFSVHLENHLYPWRAVTKRNDMKVILISLFLFPMFMCTMTPCCSQLATNCSVGRCLKCLTCLLLSITVCESRTQKWKLSRLFYFWHRVHTNCHYAPATRHCLFMSPPPFAPWLLILFLFINHTVHSHQKVTAACMNGVSWPHCLRCITGALASGRTPGSARKHARNARNGPVNDKEEIPRSRLDWKPRNNRTSNGEKWNGWRQRVGWEGMEQDAWTDTGLGLTLKTINTVTEAILGNREGWRRWGGDTWREKRKDWVWMTGERMMTRSLRKANHQWKMKWCSVASQRRGQGGPWPCWYNGWLPLVSS